eukprot:PhF_6_TR31520/c0_g1_i3/m.46457
MDTVHKCLSLQWVFGLNKDFKGAIHNLSDGNRKSIFYAVGHTGVIYDVERHQQRLLQGHRNPIIASCMSSDRRFIVTADAGEESLIVVWDTYTYLPVQSIPQQSTGVLSLDISSDGLYIVTVSKEHPQELCLWAWTESECTHPQIQTTITAHDLMTSVRFSPDHNHLVVTNGEERVLFWSWLEGAWKFYSAKLTAKESSHGNKGLGKFTQSCFVPGTTLACTATVDGDVILWDDVRSDKHTKATDKTVLKVVRLHNSGITFITCVGQYIVTGGVEGYVRFMDHQLRMIAWYEELNGGPIISASFARSAIDGQDPVKKGASTFTGTEFRCADFVVSTANAMILDVSSRSFATADTEFQRGKLLVQGQDHPIMGLAAHPSLPRLAIGGYSGHIHLWEYTTKKVLLLSIHKNMLIHTLAFDPKALYLAVGFTNGTVKILDANKLTDLQIFKPKTPDCIIHMAFSHDSQYLATADAEGCVGLYKFTHRAQDVRKPIEWVYMGRHRSHRAPITGLQFGIVPYGDAPRLVSIGEDKRLVEYNLPDTDIESGLRVRCAHKITQGAIPTGMLWAQDLVVDDKAIPRGKDGKATISLDMFIVSTNEYKVKSFATDTSRQCIKTVLGPTYGGPLNRLLAVPAQPGTKSRCVVYSTHEKVIGIIKTPLDGNPRSAMGLLAHPLEVSAVVVSHDGKYLFSAGGRDCCVNQWSLDPDSLVIDDGRPPKEHFIDVIEGGKHGEFMKEIVDYFYYAQIRSQGEETTKKRTIEGKIPFTQVPNLMRALGYYPSEHEKQYMTFEICTRFGKPSNEEIYIDFETFIRLYVNHRPVFGINKKNVERAFLAVGADPVSGIIDRDALFNLLRTRGEALHPMEVTTCLKSLIGDDVTGVEVLEEKITAKAFAENLLGFEDYEDGENGGGAGAEVGSNQGAEDVMSMGSL